MSYITTHLSSRLRLSALLVTLSIVVLLPFKAQAEGIKPAIVVNQAGYHPDWPKRAMILNKAGREPIALINAENGELVQMLSAQDSVTGPENSTVQVLNLTAIKDTGRFYLEADDLRSATFSIDKNAYKEATRLLLRSFYLQRCGHELRDAETGLSHLACHLDDGIYPRDDEVNKEGQHRDATGGWHDAGDYGKYIAPAAVTVNRLMSLYLMAPERYPDGALSIPESGNGQSDLLDELTVELDWMLKMQRSDGAVYRKLSGTKWTSAIAPEDDSQTRYVYGISSPETGKFISSMAMAARAFESSDAARAKRYLSAAEKSWDWLKYQSEQTVDWKKEDDSGSGSYLSSDTDKEVQLDTDHDDRLTAAVELFLTTKQQKYREYIQAFEPDETYSLYEWKDASSLSLLHLMEQDETPELKDIRKDIEKKLIVRADMLLTKVAASPLNLANDRFIWGSNKMTAEEGITLAHAWRLSGDKKYLNAAIDQLDFIMGRNPFNLSFVTGVGENAVKNPVHLFGRAIKRTLPGLMVGGPNDAAQDNIAPKNKGMMSYVDNERAYSVNEYAIDYNAALIGLIEVLAIYQQQVDESVEIGGYATGDTANNDIAKKVLFIGNSFTYYNNSLHYHVEQLRRNTMSTKAFADYNFRAATIAGGYWFEQQASLESLTRKKGWNVVVMQGHSREAIDDSKQLTFKSALSESLELLRERGIRPMLFMTWAYQHRPEMIKQLEPRYIELAHELEVTLVPVGSAFARALELRPDLVLHAKDGIHPSRAGTYLAASVFYAMLYKESPEGLKYTMDLDAKDATFLQEVAHSTVAKVATLQSDFARTQSLAMQDE